MNAVNFAVMCVALPGFFLVRAILGPGDGAVRRWGQAFGIEPNSRTGPLIRSYLRRTRIYRDTGWMLFAVTAGILEWFYVNVVGLALWTMMSLAGYVVGALVSEAAWKPRYPRNRRGAELRQRSVGDYLASWARVMFSVFAVTSFGWLLVLLVTPPDAWDNPPNRLERPGTVVTTLLLCLLVVLSLLIQMRVARRARPITDIELVRLDDRFRAASISACAFGGILMAGLALSPMLFENPIWSPWPPVVVVLGLPIQLFTLCAWASMVRPEPWSYGRQVVIEEHA